MLRMILLCAVVLLPIGAAIADINMDPAPEINVHIDDALGDPGVLLYMAPDDELNIGYTVTDNDTFTPVAPGPPPPPWGTPGAHADRVRLNAWAVGGTQYLQCTITPGVNNDWATQTTFTVHAKSINYTGYQHTASYGPGWEDAHDPPPGYNSHGSADDTNAVFTKYVICTAN